MDAVLDTARFMFAAVVGAFALAVLGALLLIISNAMYFTRTRDKVFSRFWLGKGLLTKGEYLLNRSGFAISVIGILGMACMVVAKMWALP